MRYADTSRLGRPFAKDPAVVRHEGRYLLYYSLPPYADHLRPAGAPPGWAIGIAESSDLEHWTRLGELLPEQDCEQNGLCAPGAIVLAGRVHLFYQTYGNGRRDAICHAVSSDGLRFARHPANPIFAPTGDWNCGRAIDADVIAHGGRLLLCAATRDPEFRQQMLVTATAPLDSDFGAATWRQLGDGPALRPELPWEQDCIEAPALFVHDGRLFMCYAGAYNNQPQQIGVAASTDGEHWTRLSDQPFLPCGAPGEWNASESGHPFAFTAEDGRLHLFYQGNCDGGRTWYLARREVTWRDGQPVLV